VDNNTNKQQKFYSLPKRYNKIPPHPNFRPFFLFLAIEPKVKNATNKGYRWSVSGLHTIEKRTKKNSEFAAMELNANGKGNNQV
jgi:hypothetical protein